MIEQKLDLKNRLLEAVTSIRSIDSIIKLLLEVPSSSSTNKKGILYNILLEVANSKSAQMTDKERKLLALFEEHRAMTVEEARLRLKFKSKRWTNELCNRFVRDEFLFLSSRNIGKYRPILIFQVKTATPEDINRAEAVYLKLKYSFKPQQEKKLHHYKCLGCREVFKVFERPPNCPKCGDKRIGEYPV